MENKKNKENNKHTMNNTKHEHIIDKLKTKNNEHTNMIKKKENRTQDTIKK